MNGRRAALLVAAAGVLASQAGHLLAYTVRFGSAAPHVQSSGAHEYFPALAKTGLGFLAIALVIMLFVVGLARVMTGRLERDSAPSYIRLLAALYTLQLAVFAIQETAEAAIAGAPAGSATALLLWGTAGQLPVAAIAALGLCWLVGRLRPALSEVRSRLVPVVRPLPPLFRASALVTWPLATEVAVSIEAAASPLNRRGPPTS